MPVTSTDIANLALSCVGAEGVLVTLDDPTKEGRLCRQHYDFSRRAVLRMHPWNFAIKRVILGPNNNPPLWGNTLAYALPADYIRVLGTDDADKIYKVENGRVLTDEAVLNLKYVADIQDTALFDSMFVQVLSLHVAMKIAFPLTQSADLKTSLMEEFKLLMPKARHVDATEDYPPSLIADEFVNVRIGPNRGWVRDPQT
jgi:hypothetical protein